MLLEFSCSNHKSLRNKALFSMLASSDTSLAGRTYEFGKNKILKSAVIYGANGSGKSNFIDALSFVKCLVMNSINHQPGQQINQMPHKLEGFNAESSYSIHFETGGVRYAYGFTLRQMLVSEEYLYYFPNGRAARIFERDGEKITAGSKFRGRFKTCQDVLKENRLMLSCAANFSSVEEVAAAFRFFSDDIVIYEASAQQQDVWLNYSLNEVAKNPQLKAVALSFMRSLGIDAQDIKVNVETRKPTIDDVRSLPPFLSDEFKNKLLAENINLISAKVVYPEFEIDLLREESTGVKKLFAMLCPLLNIIGHGKVLICDEIEAGLHESLLYGLLREFMQLSGGAQKPQIVLTTHETGLLDLNLFRRDQIWFTEMKAAGRETELYSLAEIKSVRKDESFGRGYISGKYGAIPMLNLDFAEVVREMQQVRA